MLVKWKKNVIVDCVDGDDNDWMESFFKGELQNIKDIEPVEYSIKDGENGDNIMINFLNGSSALVNSNWFEVIN